MSIGIVRYPGSNCDLDALNFFESSYFISHKERKLPSDLDQKLKMLIIPGGFAFGDRVYEKATDTYKLSPGEMALNCPVSELILDVSKRGIPILGICNGFQILVKMGLLPGELVHNQNSKFSCMHVDCKMGDMEEKLWVANQFGNYIPTSDSEVFLEYETVSQEIGCNIAGVKKNNVFGMMPHPERGCSDEFKRHLLKMLDESRVSIHDKIENLQHSEHISYKSTRKYLEKLHTKENWVIQGPGENAGIVDIGGGYAIAMRIESHNHPTFIDPYEGAATGVGGILRDIFTMGARPIAVLDFLRFGVDAHSNTLLQGAIDGISYYGNCFGVANVGGDLYRHESYNKNPLVNVACLGLVEKKNIIYGNVSREGDLLIYVGNKTGIEGVDGASMASKTFSKDNKLDKSTVQKADAFLERLLLEACIEISERQLATGMQDMGAGGILCSTFEVVKRGNKRYGGNLGCRIDLKNVPTKQEMNDYDILASESQERMLIVSNLENRDMIFEIFEKWDLEYAVIGTVTDDGNYTVVNDNHKVFTKNMEEFDKVDNEDWPEKINKVEDIIPIKIKNMELWQVYDSTIGNRTLKGPDKIGSYSILDIPEAKKKLCITWGDNFDTCYKNQLQLNYIPLGIVNCLNYGHPEDSIGDMARFLEDLTTKCQNYCVPVIGGNVSLYNKTDEKNIYPTPVLVMIGVDKV